MAVRTITRPGLLFPSFGFGAATATREEQAAFVPAQMSAMFHPVDANPGACRGPTPGDPRSSPSPRPRQMILLPEISPFRRYDQEIPPLVP